MMRSKLLLVLGLCALGATANAQIISTSIPQAAAGKAEKKAAFHVMVGYAKWDYALLKTFEREVNRELEGLASLKFDTPDGVIVAGDVAFQAGDNMTFGVGGWYNNADFKGTFTGSGILAGEKFELGKSNGDLFSLYANGFYKHVGVQVGFVRNSTTFEYSRDFQEFLGTKDEATTTDWDAFAVGRFGGERASVAIGLGLYKYGKLTLLGSEIGEGDTVFSGFANVSVKVVKNLSVDGGVWYLGESSVKDDDATRLTVGLGYTF